MGCKAMDTVTYPHPAVQQFFAEHLEPVDLMIGDPDPVVRETLRKFRTLWSPAYVMLDSRGDEVRRFIGYQSSGDFIAELRVGVGKAFMAQRKNHEAFDQFRAAADSKPPAPVSDEAVYWAGIALYLRDKKELSFLEQYWKELERRFPESRWWTAANVF